MKLYSVKRKEFLVCCAAIGHVPYNLKGLLNKQRQTGNSMEHLEQYNIIYDIIKL